MLSDNDTDAPATPRTTPQTSVRSPSNCDRSSASTVSLPLETKPQPGLGIGMLARTSSVSIFSGASDRPSSPTSVPKNFALGHEATDRVYPVRSVVSVDPTATPTPRSENEYEFPGMSAVNDITSTRNSLRRDTTVSNTSLSRPTDPPFSHPQSRCQSPVSFELAGERQRRRLSSDMTTARGTIIHSHHQVNSLIRDDLSIRSDNTQSTDDALSMSSRPDPERNRLNDTHFTARFKHVVTDGGHAVITGRDGDVLQRCEDEPIHIPGAIQSFGLLVALREEAGKLVVRVVSENSASIIGYTPAQLFKLSSFSDILTEEQADNLLDHLDFIRDGSAPNPSVNGPEVFMLSLRAPGKRMQKFWCAMHINDTNKDLVICEFELEDDLQNPLSPTAPTSPEPPKDTLGSNPTPEEFAESTSNISKPLRILRNARKKKGEAAAMEVFNVMAQIQEQLASPTSLERFLKVLIGVVKELTGLHRVMCYQFDHTFSGRVVAELVDPLATKDLYHGLHFPASDIPKQARDLYRINKVRLLYDRDQETARLVCRTVEDLEEPLDMTFVYLRAMSPIHIKYLKNMAVRSSMSISINAFDELWGLIACHSYGPKGMRVSFPIRKMCRLVGDIASRNVERLSYASRLQARKLINTSPSTSNPSGYIVASSEDLLELFNADCGALSIRDETKLLGNSRSHLQEVLAMLEFLRLRKIGSVFTSIDVTTDFPDLRYAPGFDYIAGLLFVPLSSSGSDFIVFFRQGFSREVKWAGNPYEKFDREGTEGYLEPRKSFKTWSEIIVGKSRDWSEEDVETASILCLVYGKFVEVWRQKELALESSQLQKLLLANSAHEVRTPLNAIINYLEIALEGTLDDETRDNLSRSHSASKSLVYVINDLLDLTKTEEGLDLVKEEVFNIHVMIQEATQPFRGDAQRKGLEYLVSKVDDVPHLLVGDPRRVRQVISNVIANAIQNTSTGYVKVSIGRSLEQPGPGKLELEVVIEDSGTGMTQEKVDALFSELEQVSPGNDQTDSKAPEKIAVDIPPAQGGSKAILGLGLAVVARALRNMNGRLRLKTEEGKGSRFVIQLAFAVPNASDQRCYIKSPEMNIITASPDRAIATVHESDMRSWPANRNSIDRGERPPASRRTSHDSVNSRISVHSINSVQSLKSIRSATSDVDRLIEDIQRPHLVSNPDSPKGLPRRRTNSKRLIRTSSTDEQLTMISSEIDGVQRDSIDGKVRGEERIAGSRTPLKAVRVPEYSWDRVSESNFKPASKVMFELPESGENPSETLNTDNMSVLVAEDDPVNSKIIKKRLEKLGHSVHLTVNGEECSSAFGEHASSYDVVLMDLQMPIVDGFTSTKMIRSFEKTHGDACLSIRASANGRIPIFAVSASLLERDRELYIKTGFDGWILKPVNFKRVDVLLKGILDEDARKSCLFEAGQWERGGWFEKRQGSTDVFSTDTTPNNKAPTVYPAPPPASLAKADTT